MTSRWCTLALCAAVTFGVRDAIAEPRVVLVETLDAPPLPGLAAQVQLHAGRAIEVATLEEREAASMTFATRATELVAQQDATIVVWVAAIDGESRGQRTYLVFAAGRFPGRALIELVRLDAATPAAEVERTVALKISGLFDTLVSTRPAGVALGVEPTRSATWRVEVAGSLVVERGDRELDGRIGAMIERRWGIADWTVSVGAGAHWQPSGTITSSQGVVSIDEVTPRLTLGLERSFGPATWFVRPLLGLPILLAEGTNREGSRGRATVLSPNGGAEVGARWSLSDTVELTTTLAGEAALTGQQFLLDEEVAADLRHARGLLAFGLSLPFL